MGIVENRSLGLIEEFVEEIKGSDIRIVYPEGNDERILRAARRHKRDGIIVPILIGNPEEIKALAKSEALDIEGIEIIDPETFEKKEEMIQKFIERRKGKVDEAGAREKLKDRNYFGTMLVYMGLADGLVSGAVGTTAATILPGLQIIKMGPQSKMVSGCFVMISPEDTHRYLFADSAVNFNPSASEIADIANETARTATQFGIDPKVALLSFSTKGSASSPEQEKMEEATKIAKERYPELDVDGELQFDAAIDEVVGKRKAPGSPVAGHATVFIFPDLQAGNISYKIAERLGGYTALGPILQGMAKPVNDLSRGCNVDDAYQMGIITAFQAYKSREIQ